WPLGAGTRAREALRPSPPEASARSRRGWLRCLGVSLVEARERVFVVPRQPVRRRGRDGLVVREERREVAAGVAVLELRGDDEWRVDVADESPVLRAVEERGTSLADRVLQAPLGDVVVDGRVDDTEEEGQRLPAPDQVAESTAEARVRLDALVGEEL